MSRDLFNKRNKWPGVAKRNHWSFHIKKEKENQRKEEVNN
jgi:hypothetical protein